MSDAQPRIPTSPELDEYERRKAKGEKMIPSIGPLHTHVGMSDQEIRARALECATRIIDNHPGRLTIPGDEFEAIFWENVERFEAYIRG